MSAGLSTGSRERNLNSAPEPSHAVGNDEKKRGKNYFARLDKQRAQIICISVKKFVFSMIPNKSPWWWFYEGKRLP